MSLQLQFDGTTYKYLTNETNADNLCCTKTQENTNMIEVAAYSMSLFLIKRNFRRQIVFFFYHKTIPEA